MIAVAIVAMALLLRIVIPTGFMPMVDSGRLLVGICNGTPGATMVIEIPGLAGKTDTPMAQNSCAYADLSLPSLAGADPVQLADLHAFVVASGYVATTAFALRAAAFVRPPSRAPPLTP